VSLALDAASFVLFVIGGALILTGGLGVLRMPDLYTRMHPAGITDTMGTILVLTGCLLQAELGLATVKLAAILVFLLLTTPTAAYALANAARLAGIVPLRTASGNEDAAR